MDAPELPVPPALIGVEGGLPQEGSLLDALTSAREEIASTRDVEIEIPGYAKSGIKLFARYKLLDGGELNAIGTKVSAEFKKQYERVLYAAVDTLAKACIGFSYDTGDGERHPLMHNDQVITGYNQDLAEALKIPVDPQHPVRSIVFGMFGGHEITLSAHNMRLGRWMTDTSSSVDAEFFANP